MHRQQSETTSSPSTAIFPRTPPRPTTPRVTPERKTLQLTTEEALSTISSSLDTASLIQSAAKLSLLQKSPASISSGPDIPDDNDDPPQALYSPSLQSLQTETLPALPSEQDRKRFVVRQSAQFFMSRLLTRISHNTLAPKMNPKWELYVGMLSCRIGDSVRLRLWRCQRRCCCCQPGRRHDSF